MSKCYQKHYEKYSTYLVPDWSLACTLLGHSPESLLSGLNHNVGVHLAAIDLTLDVKLTTKYLCLW